MTNLTIAGNSSGTGTFTITAPDSLNNRTINLPDANTTLLGQGTALTSSAAVATTSGTSVDFTGIPSWAKRVTLSFSGLSSSGSSPPVFRLGTSGGVQATGYACGNSVIVSSCVTTNDTTGFLLGVNTTNWSAAVVVSGRVTFDLLDAASGLWVCSGMASTTGGIYVTVGSKTLSGVLDRVRLTTLNGTDTFDAGTATVTYEG